MLPAAVKPKADALEDFVVFELLPPAVLPKVAAHGRRPVELLSKLGSDGEKSVRVAVLTNPRTPVDVMQAIHRDLPPAYVRVMVWNPDLTLELAARIAGAPLTWRQLI